MATTTTNNTPSINVERAFQIAQAAFQTAMFVYETRLAARDHAGAGQALESLNTARTAYRAASAAVCA